MANGGFILLYRDLRESWLWYDKPFSKAQAFIDMLFRCSYEDTEFRFKGQETSLNRGEFTTSQLQLSKDWGWSRHKVSDFLKTLQASGTIEYTSDREKTFIRIINYDEYQSPKKQKPNKPGEHINEQYIQYGKIL